MHVILVRTGAVAVAMIVHFHRYDIDLAVAHFTHRHQFISEFADFTGCAAKYDGFEAVVVVKVDVHRGQHEMMVLVLQLRETFGQVAGVMAVDLSLIHI